MSIYARINVPAKLLWRKTELETAIINRVLRVDYIIPLVHASINECDRCDISSDLGKTFKKHIVTNHTEILNCSIWEKG